MGWQRISKITKPFHFLDSTPMNPLTFLCVLVALGNFFVEDQAVMPTPPLTSDRIINFADTYADLAVKRIESREFHIASNAHSGSRRSDPKKALAAGSIVAAILLIPGGRRVLANGVPMSPGWNVQGTPAKVIGITMRVLGFCSAILGTLLLLDMFLGCVGVSGGGKDVDIY